MLKHHDQKLHVVDKRVNVSLPVLILVHPEGKSWQELNMKKWKQKPRRSAAYWIAPHDILSLHSYSTQDHQPWWFYPQYFGPAHINHESRKCPHGLAHRPVWAGIFSTEVPSTLSCVKLTKNSQHNWALDTETSIQLQPFLSKLSPR